MNDSPAPGAPPGPPHLPRMVPVGPLAAPQAPATLADTGVDPGLLTDLTLKLAASVTEFTAGWAAERLGLPLGLARDLLDGLRESRLVEALGQAGPLNTRYAILGRGRERADRVLEVSGYVGPAPVPLPAYAALLDWQLAHAPRVTPADVAAALADLVLPGDALLLAGLAAASERSLFVAGPPGNGKTTLGRRLHAALRGDLWVPYALAVGTEVVRLIDPQSHHPADPVPSGGGVDRRWVRIRRPLIVLGTEATLDSFDLAYHPARRSYEAPPQVKANGGVLLVDDFGRERADPRELLNRWILPLENRIDFLTLQTGEKFCVPVRQVLVVATNLDPAAVTDPAFLRRMGYRLHLGPPGPDQYARIFEECAARRGMPTDAGVLARVLDRYRAEGRELRGCEPRDLIDRAAEICRYRNQPPRLDDQVLDLAWRGYFGNQ